MPLDDVQVIIDVGARDTTYPIDYPEAVCHLFEPHPKHFKILKERFGDNKNVIGNNYGLGDKEETLGYDPYLESFEVGTAKDFSILVRTLDSYVEENNITRIDLLKIDTEAMDYKVLLGGSKAIEMARYIQYEYWDDQGPFKLLLSSRFDMEDIGLRNILCKRKK